MSERPARSITASIAVATGRIRVVPRFLSGIFRSERLSAIVLLAAAVVGLALANLPTIGPWLIELRQRALGIPALHLELSVGEWIADLLLALFFFIVAVELKAEMTTGELNSVRKALVPAIAACGGVLVPALIYLLLAGPELARGWPVPTATDIAFAVGVLAVFGRHLPRRMRVFLLALAVIDDLIGILFIAVLFASGIDLSSLAIAAVAIAVFAALSRLPRIHPGIRVPLLVAVGLIAWYFVHAGGVHPTIAGVALGLAVDGARGDRAAHRIGPWTTGVVLPVFAFSAALVAVPALDTVGPVLVALAVALPVGKAIGITLGGLLGAAIARRHQPDPVLGWDLVAMAVTGGLGFTVALLMGQLAFRGDPALVDQSVLGVLIGSLVALVAGAALIAWRSTVHAAERLSASAD